jgi:SAM-dependent methyltransferase
MTQVHAHALDLTDKEPYVPLGRVPAAHGGSAAPLVHEARVNLAQQNVVGPTRLRWLKRLVLRLSQLFTHRLVASGEALAGAVERLEAELAQVRAELAATQRELTVRVEQGLVPQVVSMELQVHEALDGLAHEVKGVAESVAAGLDAQRRALEERGGFLHASTDRLQEQLERLESAVGHDRSELHRVRAAVARVSRRTADLSDGVTATEATEAAAPDATEQQMYVDFELRFRGSRDEVMARQRDALEFVADLAGSSYPLVDLGCGRGEWLELLAEAGVRAYGVDTNDEMVAEVRSRGLEAVVGDAVTHLEGLAPSSVQAISGFHIAEHLPLSDLARLVDAALLALRPGGLLLFETPNPTNLAVGAASFYLDPTHLRPLHPQFLTFLLESRGFSDVETRFVHPLREYEETVETCASAADRLVAAGRWALFGPQDYIVAARRHEVSV